MYKKTVGILVAVSLACSSLMMDPLNAASEALLNLPKPGAMVGLTSGFEPVLIKGIKVEPKNPFLFDFIVDPGQDHLQGEALRPENQKLIKYFLASLAVKDEDVWVNLSPYEKGRNTSPTLATWYKNDLKHALLNQLYVNQGKLKGIESDLDMVGNIYQRYMEAYKKGVFNYIKEDDVSSGKSMPRKYFSGGIEGLHGQVLVRDGAMVSTDFLKVFFDSGFLKMVRVILNPIDAVSKWSAATQEGDVSSKSKEREFRKKVDNIPNSVSLNFLKRWFGRSFHDMRRQFSEKEFKWMSSINRTIYDLANKDGILEEGDKGHVVMKMDALAKVEAQWDRISPEDQIRLEKMIRSSVKALKEIEFNKKAFVVSSLEEIADSMQEFKRFKRSESPIRRAQYYRIDRIIKDRYRAYVQMEILLLGNIMAGLDNINDVQYFVQTISVRFPKLVETAIFNRPMRRLSEGAVKKMADAFGIAPGEVDAYWRTFIETHRSNKKVIDEEVDAKKEANAAYPSIFRIVFWNKYSALKSDPAKVKQYEAGISRGTALISQDSLTIDQQQAQEKIAQLNKMISEMKVHADLMMVMGVIVDEDLGFRLHFQQSFSEEMLTKLAHIFDVSPNSANEAFWSFISEHKYDPGVFDHLLDGWEGHRRPEQLNETEYRGLSLYSAAHRRFLDGMTMPTGQDLLGADIDIAMEADNYAEDVGLVAALTENSNVNGGIDLNAKEMKLSVQQDGDETGISFEPAMLEGLKSGGFQGLQPEIVAIEPAVNILAMLGLTPGP